MHRRDVLIALPLALLAACGDGGGTSTTAREAVRARLDALAPAANLAHRGLGPTRPRGEAPENSLAAFRAAMAQGADGIELDVTLTRDGALLVLHDATLDRTTTCGGCVSAVTLAAARACALLDGARQPTDEPPPTLAEAFAAVGPEVLVNVELKVAGAPCLTPDSDAAALAHAAAGEIRRLGAARRTLVSSFDEAALVALRRADPDLYAALLTFTPPPDTVERLAALDFDGVHPLWSGVSAADVARAVGLGLQVNIWTVNGDALLRETLEKRPTGIITDQPGVLRALLDASR